MAAALEEICSPRDDYGFASGGVYCFWNVKTRRPLYIGRAVDLPDRFRAHNGLRTKGSKGNKRLEVDAFFAEEQLLGYSILVRSVGSQTSTARRRRQVDREFPSSFDWVEAPDAIGSEIEYEIAESEGTAIYAYWLEHGKLPPWNKVHGARTRWNQAMRVPDSSGKLFCLSIDSLLQARRSITQLAREPLNMQFELELQAARMWAVARTIRANIQLCDHDILMALDRLPERGGGLHLEEMRRTDYLLGGAWISGTLPEAFSQAWREAWSAGSELTPVQVDPPPLRLSEERIVPKGSTRPS